MFVVEHSFRGNPVMYHPITFEPKYRIQPEFNIYRFNSHYRYIDNVHIILKNIQTWVEFTLNLHHVYYKPGFEHLNALKGCNGRDYY